MTRVFQHLYTCFLYPFFCEWASALLLSLAIVDSAVMNVCVQISLWDPHLNSFGFTFTSRTAGSHIITTSNFLRSFHIVFKLASPSYIPIPWPVHEELQRLLFLTTFSLLWILVNLPDVWGYLIWVLICIFLMTGDVKHFFLCLLVVYLKRNTYSISLPLLESNSFLLSYRSSLHILNVHILTDMIRNFFSFHWLVFYSDVCFG